MTPAPRNNLKRLLQPRSIAFIGGNSAALAVEQCLRGGFTGDIWCVNPKRGDMHGVPCFPSVTDLPGPPDAVFLAVPAEHASSTVAALAAIGAGGVAGYTAGFGEIGEDGAALERELADAAGDMALIGPNCSGILSYAHSAVLWPFDHDHHPAGRGVAFISQSGMLGNTLTMNRRSVPMSYVISSGNQAMLGVEDFLDILIDDPLVSAVALYIEGLRDVARFADVALRAVALGIPIVAFKAGRSDVGAQLTVTHTGSLSGSDALYSALFERTGVIRVTSPVQMLETLKLVTVAGVPEGCRLAAFTCSGGDSTMVADAAESIGVVLPQPSADVAAALRAVLPPIATVANPLDYTTPLWGNEPEVERALSAALRDGFDAALMVQDYPVHNPGRSYEPYLADARAFMRATTVADIPAMVCSVLPEDIDNETRGWMIEGGVAPVQGIDEAVTAIAGATSLGRLRRRIREGLDPASLRLVKDDGPAHGDHILDEWQGKRLLADAGIVIPEGRLATTADAPQAADELGYPVAVKMVSAALPHKTEAGAVRLNLGDAEAVTTACREIASSVDAHAPGAGADAFLIERMVAEPIAELIVGIRRDPQFGLVMVIGSGGILVELVADAVSMLLPVDRDMIETAIARLSVDKLLDGFRGRPAADRNALCDTILSVAAFALENRCWLAELDINPLMITADGPIAADVLIRGGDGCPV